MVKDERSLLVKRQSQELLEGTEKKKTKSKSKASPFDCFDIVEDVHFPKKKDVVETTEEKKKHLYTCLQFPKGFSKTTCCQYCPLKNPFWPADKCKTPNEDMTNDRATFTFWETTLNTAAGRTSYIANGYKMTKPAASAKTWVLEFMMEMLPTENMPSGKWYPSQAAATDTLDAAGGVKVAKCQPIISFIQQHGTTTESHITGAFGGTGEMPASISCHCTGISTAPCKFFSDEACTTEMTVTEFPVNYYAEGAEPPATPTVPARDGNPDTPTVPSPSVAGTNDAISLQGLDGNTPGISGVPPFSEGERGTAVANLPTKDGTGGHKIAKHSFDARYPSFWISSDAVLAVALHGRRDFLTTCGTPLEPYIKLYSATCDLEDVENGNLMAKIKIPGYTDFLKQDGIDFSGGNLYTTSTSAKLTALMPDLTSTPPVDITEAVRIIDATKGTDAGDGAATPPQPGSQASTCTTFTWDMSKVAPTTTGPGNFKTGEFVDPFNPTATEVVGGTIVCYCAAEKLACALKELTGFATKTPEEIKTNCKATPTLIITTMLTNGDETCQALEQGGGGALPMTILGSDGTTATAILMTEGDTAIGNIKTNIKALAGTCR